MKRWKKVLIFSIVGLGLLTIVARLTGAIQFYRIPTPSSEPTVKTGQYIFVTNLHSPKRDNLVIYKQAKTDSIGVENGTGGYGEIYLHRLTAIENDVIQMKAGVLYVNGKNADINKNLLHYYQVANEALENLPVDMEAPGTAYQISNTESVVNLTDSQVAAYSGKINIKKYFPEDNSDQGPFSWYDNQNKWTIDEFGPISVPVGYGFMMGDNRHNSLDSRFTGFVKLSDIKGVKL